ncbi:MAG: hypothetical protein ABJ237_11345, partial [Parasphingorhabdus sp.]
MKKLFWNARPMVFATLVAATCSLASPVLAQTEEEEESPAMTPAEVLAAAPTEHWLPISVSDLMVLTLPDATDGAKRQAVIQLLPANLS